VTFVYPPVIPRDAVVGVPKEYGEAVLDNTLSLVATIVRTEDVLGAWR
jgi:biuret amidohydrolase